MRAAPGTARPGPCVLTALSDTRSVCATGGGSCTPSPGATLRAEAASTPRSGSRGRGGASGRNLWAWPRLPVNTGVGRAPGLRVSAQRLRRLRRVPARPSARLVRVPPRPSSARAPRLPSAHPSLPPGSQPLSRPPGPALDTQDRHAPRRPPAARAAMGVEGCTKCIKYLLFVFNFVFWVSLHRGWEGTPRSRQAAHSARPRQGGAAGQPSCGATCVRPARVGGRA